MLHGKTVNKLSIIYIPTKKYVLYLISIAYMFGDPENSVSCCSLLEIPKMFLLLIYFFVDTRNKKKQVQRHHMHYKQ